MVGTILGVSRVVVLGENLVVERLGGMCERVLLLVSPSAQRNRDEGKARIEGFKRPWLTIFETDIQEPKCCGGARFCKCTEE